MVLGEGEMVLVITRRLFERDLRRHFIGIVEQVTSGTARLNGYAFVFDESNSEFQRRDKPRVRIVPLADAGLIILVLPQPLVLEELYYRVNEAGRRVLTDGKSFSLNISEFGSLR